jgi:hypothetical protein
VARANAEDSSLAVRFNDAAIEHAHRLILQVCHLAGPTALIDDARASLRAEGVTAAIRNRNTAALFDWLVAILSYQGISDQVAADYIERHGQATWHVIESDLARGPSCPKLKSYWHFENCGYNKGRYTCGEPNHLASCPLPNHWLRNGRLNQTAYSLYLFIRDVADGDLVGWIDRLLQIASRPAGPDRLTRMNTALIEPLKEVYGVSDKILMLALACLFLGSHRRRWREVGGGMIAVDTLVHNFLHRTGILHRCGADHTYGPGCYRPGGCADIIEAVAHRIDARQFNRRFPKTFPRFVQNAIWRYCSLDGRDICNGNRIDDHRRCTNKECDLYSICDRIRLHKSSKNGTISSV